jgi:hypothetical protein
MRILLMKSNKKSASITAALLCGPLLVLQGCGLAATPPVSVAMKSAEEQTPGEAASPDTKTTTPDSTGTASTAPTAKAGGVGDFVGTITLSDEPPKLAPVVAMGASVQDKATCSAVEVPNESLVVDPASKGIQNIFVYLEKAPAGAKPISAPEKQVFDQKGCKFHPHAMIVRTKVPLMVLSEDPVAHNTHTFPERNSVFNQVIPANTRDGKILVNYGSAEKAPIEVKCDYHNWMKAYHLPLDHGFAAVTNEKGEFTIKGLPAGTHTFKVWHESGGALERAYKVEIQGGDKATVKTLSYATAKFIK